MKRSYIDIPAFGLVAFPVIRRDPLGGGTNAVRKPRRRDGIGRVHPCFGEACPLHPEGVRVVSPVLQRPLISAAATVVNTAVVNHEIAANARNMNMSL